MSIQYKGSLTLSAGGTYNSTCYAAYSGDLAIAELPFPLTIAFDPRRLCYFLEWDQVDSPLQIDGGSVKLVCDEVVLLDVKLGKGPFPPTRSGSYGSSMGRKGLWAKVCVDLKLVPSQSRLEKETAIEKEYERKKATLSVVYANLLTARQSANVRLVFPRSGHQLWVDEETCKLASPYLKQLLTSSFSEGTSSSTPVAPAKPSEPYPFEESDDETDQHKPKKGTLAGDDLGPPYKTVVVKDAAYSTYFAVLVWLQAGYISFAPLLSSLHCTTTSCEAAVKARTAAVCELVKKNNPLLPPPVSPKSVYRLAHLLELDDLSSLALANLSSQLTPENAAYELYSDVATCYSAVRDVILDYVVESWSEVKDAKATKEMEAKAEVGELEAAALATAMKLARRLMEGKKA